MAEKLRLKLLNIAVIDKITVSSKAPDTQNEVPFRLGTCIEKKTILEYDEKQLEIFEIFTFFCKKKKWRWRNEKTSTRIRNDQKYNYWPSIDQRHDNWTRTCYNTARNN